MLSGTHKAGGISPAVHLIESFTSISTPGVNPAAGETELHMW